jgi:hypothetical protein
MDEKERQELVKLDTQAFWVNLFVLVIMFVGGGVLTFYPKFDWFLGVVLLVLSGQTLRNFLYWNKHTRMR